MRVAWPVVAVVVVLMVLTTRAAAAAVPRSEWERCTIAQDKTAIVLDLIEHPWDGWAHFCATQLAPLMMTEGTGNHATAEQLARLLQATGYFAQVHCAREPEQGLTLCALTPQSVVGKVTLDGHMPFPMLASDLRRRLFLSPGSVYTPERGQERAQRLVGYLEREGFFDLSAQVHTTTATRSDLQHVVDVSVTLSGGSRARLGEVRLVGDRIVDVKVVDSALRRYWVQWIIERRFAHLALREDVEALENRLRAQGWPEARVAFTTTRDARAGRVDVEVRIDSGPELALEFSGNQAMPDDDLAELATFVEAGAVSLDEAKRSAENMRMRYQELGFADVQVQPQLLAPDPARSVARFDVVEGQKSAISRVTLRGVEASDADKILRTVRLRTHATSMFRTRRWVQRWVDADCGDIEAAYVAHGFAPVQVTAQRARLADGSLEAIFDIRAGVQRRVGKVHITGLPAVVTESGVLRDLKLKPGRPYRSDKLPRDRQAVLLALQGEGFLAAEVEQSSTASSDARVDLHYQVTAGPASRLASVLVRGQRRTWPSLVRQEIDVEQGAPLSPQALAASRRRLQNLGIFSSVELTPLPTLVPERTWLMVAVQERTSRSLDAAVSLSTDDLFAVGADYADRNLFGRAIALEVTARLSNASERLPTWLRIGNRDAASLQLRAPEPLRLPFDLTYSGSLVFQDTVLFTEERVQTGLGLSRRLLDRNRCTGCPTILVSLAWEAKWSKIVSKVEPGSLTDAAFDRVFRISPSLLIDATDQQLDPQRGFRQSARLDLAHPWLGGGAASRAFWRAWGTSSAFFRLWTPRRGGLHPASPLAGPINLATSMRYGVAAPLGSDHRLAASESFAYGGDLSLRGALERASLIGVPDGRYLVAGTIELRWRALRQLWLGSFELGPFVDFGVVARARGQLFDDPAVTSGPTVRYVTPVGPLAASYAWPLRRPQAIVTREPRAMPARGRFHLTFGGAY